MKRELLECMTVKRSVITFFAMALVGAIPTNLSIAAQTITIAPSGDETGVIDAVNIESALQAVDPGGVVQLTSGHFYASRGIVVEGFNGTLEGAGKGATILEAVRFSPNVGGEFLFPFTSAYTPNPVFTPSLLWFEFPEGSLTIKNLTLEVNDPSPCAEYNIWGGGRSTTALTHLIADWGGECDTTLENVEMKGSAGDHFGNNLGAGGHFMRGDAPTYDAEGDLIIKNCSIENAEIGLVPMWFKDSIVIITDNTISNARLPVWIGRSMTNCSITVSDNTISDCTATAITVILDPFSGLSQYMLNKNRMIRVVRGFLLVDNRQRWDKEKAGDFVVSHNDIEAVPFARWTAGVTSVYAKDAVITNNRISGTGGRDAIRVFGESNQLIANNCQGFSSTEGFPEIWLRSTSTNNLVVGSGNLSSGVVDQGTGNILVGVNNMGAGIGQEVSDAMSDEDRHPFPY